MIVENKMTKSIELDHVGPIERLSIPVPDGGGVVVLHGRSGAGKTHAITAVGALSDEKLRKVLRASDGVPSGKIEGLGVTVRLGRSNTARGELECESLDSGVDPSLLVDPGLKDPLAADSRRLATLVRLAGIRVTADQWSAAVGEAAEEIAVKDLVSDDPVASADKIRRRLHEVALAKERMADSRAAEAAALAKTIADVDLSTPDNEAELRRRYDSAYERVIEARQSIAARKRAESSREKAASMLENMQSMESRSSSELTAKIEAAKDQISLCRERIQRWEEMIAAEQTEMAKLQAERKAHESELASAQIREEQMVELAKIVESSLPDDVSAEDLALLESAQIAAQSAMSRGEVTRRAKQTKAKADQLAAAAERDRRASLTLRDLARSTDSVLEQALADAGFTTIKVHDGRLCVESERGLEPVSELSTGERWRLALDLAARGLPQGALLSVQQEGWQSLDYELRREVAAMARERGLTIITAEVDQGELRAEVV